MYQQNPIDTVKSLKRLLVSDGIMLFQESDESGSLLNGKGFNLHNQVQNWIWQTVRCEGGDTHIGSQLYNLMKKAGIHPQMNHLDKRLQEEMSNADKAFARDLTYGICAKK